MLTIKISIDINKTVILKVKVKLAIKSNKPTIKSNKSVINSNKLKIK
jgi:hypothetical protein